MKLSLVSCKKLCFIDVQIIKPTDRASLEYVVWSMVNGLVLSWIIKSVIPKIGCTIMQAGSANEAWQELEW